MMVLTLPVVRKKGEKEKERKEKEKKKSRLQKAYKDRTNDMMRPY